MYAYKKYADEQLVELLKNSDTQAFTEIYNRYWDKLYIVSGNKLNDCYLAQEIVQDIFVDIWNRRFTLNLSGNLSNYLAAAVKYKVINARNKRNKQQEVKQEISRDIETAYYSLEHQLNFEELKDRLGALVANLPEKCRLVYTLSRDAGYPQKEIANKLQISEKTVESHLTRALKIIRSGLHLFSRIYSALKKPVLAN